MRHNSHKTIIIISICALVSIFILLIWDLLTSDPYVSLTINPFKIDWNNFSFENININALIQSLLSAVISLALTIFLIEIILRESREKEIEYKRSLQVDNIAKVLALPLYKYQLAGEFISNRITAPKQEINTDVDGSILAEVFLPCLCSDEPLLRNKIEYYSSKLTDLKSIITNILINTDLSNNKELSDLLTDFLMYVNIYDPCPRIIELNDEKRINPKTKDFVIKTLPATNLEEIQSDNIFFPFRILKSLLKYQKEFHTKLNDVFPQLTTNINLSDRPLN